MHFWLKLYLIWYVDLYYSSLIYLEKWNGQLRTLCLQREETLMSVVSHSLEVFFKLLLLQFICQFWLHQVFIAEHVLSLMSASGVYSRCGVWASHTKALLTAEHRLLVPGVSSCAARAQLVALRHVGFSQTWDGN